MGALINLASKPSPSHFPSATFAATNEIPSTQCKEPQIVAANATTTQNQTYVNKVGAFSGIDLAGKTVFIQFTIMDDGTYNVLSNTNDRIYIDHTFGLSDADMTATVKDSGQTYLTRNVSSMIRYIQSLGWSYTIKAGILYTNISSGALNPACSTTFAPLT